MKQALNAAESAGMDIPALNVDQAQFRFELNEDAMGSEKLAEGIRAFVADAKKLDTIIEQAKQAAS